MSKKSIPNSIMSCGDCQDCRSQLKAQQNLHDSITSLSSNEDNDTKNCNLEPCRGEHQFCEKVPEKKFFEFCRRLLLCQKERKYIPRSNLECWHCYQNQQENLVDDCKNFHVDCQETTRNDIYDCCCQPTKPKRLFRLYPIPELSWNKFGRFSTCGLASSLCPNRRLYGRAYRNRRRRRCAGRQLFNWTGV